jgi:3-hydroxybutyryl-CoA dehydrogenase
MSILTSFVRHFSSSSQLPRRVGVLGSGQMGTGIGLVAALTARLPVLMFDANPAALEKSKSFMAQVLQKDVTKGKITSSVSSEAFSRVSFVSSLDSFHEVDFAIEAVAENEEIKKKLFSALTQITKQDAILASNTSSISLTRLASAAGSQRSSQVIGMHFMNPVPVMKLVEIIEAMQTSQETKQKTLNLAAAMGKVVSVSKDVPGFIANRLLMPYLNEAFYALSEGIGTAKDIDITMKLGTGVPMGPLTLADFIGLDTCLAIMKVLHQGLGESKYRPAPLLQLYVDAGYLGKKSGRGVFMYDQTGKQVE